MSAFCTAVKVCRTFPLPLGEGFEKVCGLYANLRTCSGVLQMPTLLPNLHKPMSIANGDLRFLTSTMTLLPTEGSVRGLRAREKFDRPEFVALHARPARLKQWVAGVECCRAPSFKRW